MYIKDLHGSKCTLKICMVQNVHSRFAWFKMYIKDLHGLKWTLKICMVQNVH